jgi:LysR family transcriptional regulator, low CO2-responsive transcriptional regulator
MKNATLRQLKVFECVARHLNFTRAARELHLTQPAVSTQVKLLEEHAGMPLFEQLGKKVYMTPAGAEMLHHSRAIIRQLREADEAMQQQRGVSKGRLRVTVISAGDYFFPHLLGAFLRLHPGVNVDLSVANRAELLRRIAENDTDLGAMVRLPEDRDLQAVSFAQHPYVIVAPPLHPLAARRNIALSLIAGERFIAREQGSDTRSAMAHAFGHWLPRLDLVMEIGSNEMIKQAVMAGMGLAFLSAYAIALEIKAGSLVVLDVQGFPLMENWYVVHRRDKRLLPVASAFKAFLIEDGAALIERNTHIGALRAARAPRKPGAPRRPKAPSTRR